MIDWSHFSSWAAPLNSAFGAGLGAAFYILLNTQSYLINRSYDPKYNAVYVARFITGTIAGIILATALGPLVTKQFGTEGQFSVTPGILAILGGYAAEAVQQVLQRLVEVMLTAVRGDGSAQAQVRATAASAARATQLQNLLTQYERADDTKKAALLEQVHALLASPLPTT